MQDGRSKPSETPQGQFWLAKPFLEPSPTQFQSSSGFKIEQVQPPSWCVSHETRGIVISPPWKLESEQIEVTKPVDFGMLRTWSLYWDYIDMPDNSMIGFSWDHFPDLSLLSREGIIGQTKVYVSGVAISGRDIMLESHLSAYRALEAANPGVWSLASGPGTFVLPHQAVDEGRGMLVKLVNSIPIPAENASLEGILEFKRRRRPELDAFRSHLDKLYLDIVNTENDRDLKARRTIEDLDRTIRDHIRVCKESSLPFKLGPIEATINVGNIASAWLAAGALTTTFSMPLVGALVGGIGVSALGSIGVSGALKRSKISGSPFAYTTALAQELPSLSQI